MVSRLRVEDTRPKLPRGPCGDFWEHALGRPVRTSREKSCDVAPDSLGDSSVLRINIKPEASGSGGHTA